MIKLCQPEEELPRWHTDHLMFTQLLSTLSAHQAYVRLLNQEDQRGRTSSTGTLMMLHVEEALMGPNTTMAMTGMKESHDITTTLQITDQLEVLIIEETLRGISKRLLDRISDMPSIVLGGSLGTMEYLVSSRVRKRLDKPRICTMY